MMKDLAVSIREYRSEDDREIEVCLAELQDFSKLINKNVADGTVAPRYLQHLLARCGETDGKLFVAESNNRVVGMVCVFARIQSEAVDEEEYDYAYVSDLVVLAHHRSMGLGRALLKRAEDYAVSRGATLLRINVLARNDVARDLYVRYGFDELLVALQKNLEPLS